MAPKVRRGRSRGTRDPAQQDLRDHHHGRELDELDFLLDYALALGLVAAAQAALAVGVAAGPLDLDVEGPVPLLGVIGVADAVLGTK